MNICVERRLIEVNVLDADDIGVMPHPFFKQSKKRDLAFQRPDPVRPEAELKHAAVFQRLVASHPDFAESALAKFFLQNPFCVRDSLFHRRTPTEHFFDIGREGSLGLFRIGWWRQGGLADFADLANLHCVFNPLQPVRTMIQPRERLDARNILTF